jgi:hypothetical protein
MLKKEVKGELLFRFAGERPGTLGSLGSALGWSIGGKMLDDAIDTMSPVTCVARLVRFRFKGEPPFEG